MRERAEGHIPDDVTPLTTRAWVDLTVKSAASGKKAVIRVAVDGFNGKARYGQISKPMA